METFGLNEKEKQNIIFVRNLKSQFLSNLAHQLHFHAAPILWNNLPSEITGTLPKYLGCTESDQVDHSDIVMANGILLIEELFRLSQNDLFGYKKDQLIYLFSIAAQTHDLNYASLETYGSQEKNSIGRAYPYYEKIDLDEEEIKLISSAVLQTNLGLLLSTEDETIKYVQQTANNNIIALILQLADTGFSTLEDNVRYFIECRNTEQARFMHQLALKGVDGWIAVQKKFFENVLDTHLKTINSIDRLDKLQKSFLVACISDRLKIFTEDEFESIWRDALINTTL